MKVTGSSPAWATRGTWSASTACSTLSERTTHRIAAYDATTGAFMRVVVSGAALASMNTSIRRMQRNPGVTLDAARAAVRRARRVRSTGTVAVLRQSDGAAAGALRAPWSPAQLEVVVASPYVDDGANFFKFAVSPGHLRPAGHGVRLCILGASYSGRPAAYLPGGAQWDYGNMLSGEGPGGSDGHRPRLRGWPSSVGRMAHASSEEGIWLVSKSIPSDGAWGGAACSSSSACGWSRAGT